MRTLFYTVILATRFSFVLNGVYTRLQTVHRCGPLYEANGGRKLRQVLTRGYAVAPEIWGNPNTAHIIWSIHRTYVPRFSPVPLFASSS